MAYDAVIVGSGVAGMTAGILLAREGKKVLVVEQYRKPGGLMLGYHRQGSRFPTGVHCLGSLEEGQPLWRYFKYLGVLDRIKLVKMDPGGFNEYVFPDQTFLIPQGHQAFQEKLLEYFPQEKQAILRFVEDIKKIVKNFSLYNLRSEVESPLEMSFLQPVSAYLDSLTDSRELKGVLSAINPLFGIPPEECPRYILSLVLDSFLKSSWRIDESQGSLVDGMVNSLKNQGGEIRCKSLVVEITSDSEGVKGLRLDGGEYIETDTVIFTGHPKQLPDLCPKGTLRPAFKRRLSEAPEGTGTFGIALQWEGEKCPLVLRDVFLYNSWDVGKQYRQKLFTKREVPGLIYCSGSPEPTKGNYSVVALCCMSSEEMTPWEDTQSGKRPENYREAKEALVAQVFSMLKEKWPEAASNMAVVDSFSPLTFRDYTLTFSGSAYGLKKSVAKLRHSTLKAVTRIKGLLLAGQSVVLPGVLGTVISSVDACGFLLSHQYLINQISKETE